MPCRKIVLFMLHCAEVITGEKMNKKNFLMLLPVFLSVWLGCGLMAEQGVPKEQINADMHDKTI